jgi:hypothetical protein
MASLLLFRKPDLTTLRPQTNFSLMILCLFQNHYLYIVKYTFSINLIRFRAWALLFVFVLFSSLKIRFRVLIRFLFLLCPDYMQWSDLARLGLNSDCFGKSGPKMVWIAQPKSEFWSRVMSNLQIPLKWSQEKSFCLKIWTDTAHGHHLSILVKMFPYRQIMQARPLVQRVHDDEAKLFVPATIYR